MVKIFQHFGDHLCFHHQGQVHIITLMMGTKVVPETLEKFKHLTWLMVREDFINVNRHEIFASDRFTLVRRKDTL